MSENKIKKVPVLLMHRLDPVSEDVNTRYTKLGELHISLEGEKYLLNGYFLEPGVVVKKYLVDPKSGVKRVLEGDLLEVSLVPIPSEEAEVN